MNAVARGIDKLAQSTGGLMRRWGLVVKPPFEWPSPLHGVPPLADGAPELFAQVSDESSRKSIAMQGTIFIL
jgi:hypothetical protein